MSAADIAMGLSVLAAFIVLFYFPKIERKFKKRDGKTRVSVEKVEAAREYLRSVNKIPLENIVWTRQGRDLPVDDDLIKDWKFIGLSNAEFVELRLNGQEVVDD